MNQFYQQLPSIIKNKLMDIRKRGRPFQCKHHDEDCWKIVLASMKNRIKKTKRQKGAKIERKNKLNICGKI